MVVSYSLGFLLGILAVIVLSKTLTIGRLLTALAVTGGAVLSALALHLAAYYFLEAAGLLHTGWSWAPPAAGILIWCALCLAAARGRSASSPA